MSNVLAIYARPNPAGNNHTKCFDKNVHITQPDTKNIPNCDVSLANGERNIAIRYIFLRMVV